MVSVNRTAAGSRVESRYPRRVMKDSVRGCAHTEYPSMLRNRHDMCRLDVDSLVGEHGIRM